MFKVKSVYIEKAKIGLADGRINEMLEDVNGEITNVNIIETGTMIVAFCTYKTIEGSKTGNEKSTRSKATEAKVTRKGKSKT